MGETDPAVVRNALDYLFERERYVEADQIVRQLVARPQPLVMDPDPTRADLSVSLDGLGGGAIQAAQRAAAQSNDIRDRLWLAQVLELAALRAAASGTADQDKPLQARAEAILRQAVASSPTSPAMRMRLLQFLVRTGQPEKPETCLAEARREVPAHRASLLLAQAQEILGNGSEAAKSWEAALVGARDACTLERVAEACTRLGGERVWEEQLERVLSEGAKANHAAVVWARRKLAWILVTRNNRQDRQRALHLVEENLTQHPESLPDQRLKAVLLAATFNPNRRHQAIQFLEGSFEGKWDSAPEERFLLPQLYAADGDSTKSYGHFRSLLARHPEEPRYATAFVSALIRWNKLDDAEQRLEWLEKLAPERFSTVALRSELLSQRGRPERALEVLRSSLASGYAGPDDAPRRSEQVAASLEGLARRLTSTDRAEVAQRAAQAAEALRRDLAKQRPESGIALAAILAEQGRAEESLEEFEKSAPCAGAGTIADAALKLLALAATPRHAERMEKTLARALEKHHRAPCLLTAMALLATKRERFPQAESLWREILRTDGEDATALNNLALQLAMQRRELDEALRLVETAMQIVGPAPTLLDSRATIHLARGDPDKALGDLNAAIAQAPHPIWYYRKARALEALNDEAGAREALLKSRTLGLKPEMLHPLERAGHVADDHSIRTPTDPGT